MASCYKVVHSVQAALRAGLDMVNCSGWLSAVAALVCIALKYLQADKFPVLCAANIFSLLKSKFLNKRYTLVKLD